MTTKGLTVRFSGRAVLNNVDMVLRKGETLALMGLSGVGKSTTLRCLMGFQHANEGDIHLFGQLIHSNGREMIKGKDMDRLRRRIGMVFQQPALFDSMTVGDNVAFGLREQQHLSEEEILRRVAENLRIVDLEGLEHLYPSQMSGGMQKRASIARAICTEPELLLYDEPTTGLDPIISNVINELILSLQRRLGASAIVVTHDLHSAYTIATRIAFLYEGKIVEEGPPDQFQKSTNPYVVQFREGNTHGPIKV
ncbi:MAG TPA: ATP-binding cassette domain-containing protein [Candidatus Xenobia bacterium]